MRWKEKSSVPIVILPQALERERLEFECLATGRNLICTSSLCVLPSSNRPVRHSPFRPWEWVPSPDFQDEWKGRQEQMDLLVEKPRNWQTRAPSLHISRKPITSNVGAPQDKPFAEIGSALSENPGNEVWGSCDSSKTKVSNCLNQSWRGAASRATATSFSHTMHVFHSRTAQWIPASSSVRCSEQNWAAGWAGKLCSGSYKRRKLGMRLRLIHSKGEKLGMVRLPSSTQRRMRFKVVGRISSWSELILCPVISSNLETLNHCNPPWKPIAQNIPYQPTKNLPFLDDVTCGCTRWCIVRHLIDLNLAVPKGLI